jgi:urease accessory protein
MKRIQKVVGPGHTIAKALLRRAPTLTLTFESRSNGQEAAALDNGEEVALLLPEGTVLRDGDALIADDGNFVRVVAAPEPVWRATCVDPQVMLRAAYCLGNRHMPVEIGKDYLQLAQAPALRDLLLRLGLTVVNIEAPFEPEAETYSAAHDHGHDHDHSHDHDHGHGHGHSHGHEHEHDGAHEHITRKHGHKH